MQIEFYMQIGHDYFRCKTEKAFTGQACSYGSHSKADTASKRRSFSNSFNISLPTYVNLKRERLQSEY